MKRRIFLNDSIIAATSIATGGIFLPHKAAAITDPFGIGLIIAITPPIISSFVGLFSQNKTIDVEREKMALQEKMNAMRIQEGIVQQQVSDINKWLYTGLQGGVISYRAAIDAYSKTLTNMHLSNNLYGSNTYVAVKDGVMYLERGNYGGNMHAPSTNFASAHYQKTGEIPVPLGNPSGMDRGNMTSVIDKVAKSVSMSGSEFSKKYAISAERQFSSAKNPTSNNGDVSLYTVFNKEQLANEKTITPYFLAA
jgi:hypothetical protein